MKRNPKLLIAALAAFAFVCAAATKAAFALTSTGTVAVSATVVKNCVFTNGTLTFTGYDPVGANATANLDVASTGFTVACTKGVAYSIALDLGANALGTTRRMVSGTNFLSYEIYSDTGRTVVWNATNVVTGTAPSRAPIALTAFGRVTAAQDVPVGTYNDTVTATVTF